MKPLATFSLYELENYRVCHPFEKLAYGMGKFCIYFFVFVHKYIINFVRCVYKVDLDTTRKMSKL